MISVKVKGVYARKWWLLVPYWQKVLNCKALFYSFADENAASNQLMHKVEKDTGFQIPQGARLWCEFHFSEDRTKFKCWFPL